MAAVLEGDVWGVLGPGEAVPVAAQLAGGRNKGRRQRRHCLEREEGASEG